MAFLKKKAAKDSIQSEEISVDSADQEDAAVENPAPEAPEESPEPIQGETDEQPKKNYIP